MKIEEFLNAVKGIKTLDELDAYVRTHLPACRVGTDVWESDGKVYINGEENANDYAEVLEDIVNGVAYIRPYEHDGYGRWFSVTV